MVLQDLRLRWSAQTSLPPSSVALIQRLLEHDHHEMRKVLFTLGAQTGAQPSTLSADQKAMDAVVLLVDDQVREHNADNHIASRAG